MSKGDAVLISVPFARVSEVVLVGRGVGATTPCLHALLAAGVALTMVSRTGKLLGRLRPPEAHNLPLRQLQYQRGEDVAFCLVLSRAIVRGKLRNSRTMLRRILRQKRNLDRIGLQASGNQAVEQIRAALQKTKGASTLATLRGLEGSAARAYFRTYRIALREEFQFKKHTRRPPKDPANALLSLSYSFLKQAMITACYTVGLDPYDGFFHADKYGRPALALDLMEEFRSGFADSLVLQMINKNVFSAGDFQENQYLSSRALRRFLYQFQRRLNRRVIHPLAGRALSYPKLFEIQARQLRKVIEGEEEGYCSFRLR